MPRRFLERAEVSTVPMTRGGGLDAGRGLGMGGNS